MGSLPIVVLAKDLVFVCTSCTGIINYCSLQLAVVAEVENDFQTDCSVIGAIVSLGFGKLVEGFMKTLAC